MEKSIKEISLEIIKLNEELKGLESFLENAIISAIVRMHDAEYFQDFV